MIEERIKFLYNLYWVITGLAFLWFVLLFLSVVNDNFPGLVLLILGIPVWQYMKYLAKHNDIEIPASVKGGLFMILFMVVMFLGVADKLILVFVELLKEFFQGRAIVSQIF
jgi:hypothetical protein